MAAASHSDQYGEEYYRTGCTRGDGPPYRKGEPLWEAFFGRVADEIVLSLKPRTVFDAGCAIGFLVEALWDRGVTAHGRDISEFAISQVRPDVKPYCEIRSVTDPIDGRYDLVTCIEILEHLPESDATAAIDALTEASDKVLFSSSPNDFDEPTHVNVKPPIYWSRLFAQRSFRPVMHYDASFIAPHAVLFVRSDEVPSDDLLMGHAELVRIRLALAAAAEHASGLNSALSATRDEKSESERQLAEARLRLEADLDAAQAAQAALDDIRESSAAELRASELERQALEERLIQAERAVTQAERALAQTEQALTQAEQALAQAEQTLSLMKTSTSWRLTTPARAVNAKLRRTLRKGR